MKRNNKKQTFLEEYICSFLGSHENKSERSSAKAA
jgi:hypothetical protein